MGEFRDYRLTIPAGVFLLTCIVLLLSDADTSHWLTAYAKSGQDSLATLAIVLGAIFTSLALGYVLSLAVVATVECMNEACQESTPGHKERLRRWIDCDTSSNRIAISVQNLILHGTAGKGFMDFLTRRVTATYVAWTSALAVVVAAIFICSCAPYILTPYQSFSPHSGVWLVLTGIVVLMWWTGLSAKKELWNGITQYLQHGRTIREIDQLNCSAPHWPRDQPNPAASGDQPGRPGPQ